MGKSLGDHMLEQLTLLGTNNIKWTQKNLAHTHKSKKKKEVKTPSNIIYAYDMTIKPPAEKFFKIIVNTKTESKKQNIAKKIQTSSAFNFKIIPGFSRKGR